MTTRLAGGCQCGGVRYEITGAPLDLYVCHCRECRAQSASAFGISVIIARTGLRVIRGAPRSWSRTTAAGHVMDCWFCADCGTRLWHVTRNGDTLSVKGGSLDTPPDLSQAKHIWTTRQLAGVVIPEGAETHEEEP